MMRDRNTDIQYNILQMIVKKRNLFLFDVKFSHNLRMKVGVER